MDNWDFQQWRASLGALDSRAAALVGLASAERISGCLGDERFGRHGRSGVQVVSDLLGECWATASAGEGTSSARIRELAGRLANCSGDYLTLSLTEMFHSYEPLAEEDDDEDDEDPGDGAPDLDEFLEEAEPEGAVMMHLDAMTAVSEAAAACTGGSWDGALRCLQITAIAASQHDPRLPGPGVEMQRQREDLALVQAAGSTELPRLMADLRVRAQADASGWKRVTEQLNLLHS
ncbi:hypothetical protein OG196_00590 [Kitasatospora purpeofusca]|uniref:hypothetical protein n=1 Tax=Kitasatospora purpeofusca TaxID=67352 RepID=UPI002E111F6F|nr:hypothetical protein OG196_00590 [Kitasatospora purpeofusca]